jgi:hypothetical protein
VRIGYRVHHRYHGTPICLVLASGTIVFVSLDLGLAYRFSLMYQKDDVSCNESHLLFLQELAASKKDGNKLDQMTGMKKSFTSRIAVVFVGTMRPSPANTAGNDER